MISDCELWLLCLESAVLLCGRVGDLSPESAIAMAHRLWEELPS